MTVRAVRPGEPVVLSLPAPETIDQLPIEVLPGLVVQLAALAMRAGARLAVVRPPAPIEPDDLLDADEVATLTRRSVSWLHHHGHTLPGFRQPHGRGGRKFWSRRALLAWITAGDGAG